MLGLRFRIRVKVVRVRVKCNYINRGVHRARVRVRGLLFRATDIRQHITIPTQLY